MVRYASRMQAVRALEARQAAIEEAAPAKATPKKQAPPPHGLSRKEQRELDRLPEQLEALETELEEIENTLGDPDTYQSRADEVDGLNQRLKELEESIASTYAVGSPRGQRVVRGLCPRSRSRCSNFPSSTAIIHAATSAREMLSMAPNRGTTRTACERTVAVRVAHSTNPIRSQRRPTP